MDSGSLHLRLIKRKGVASFAWKRETKLFYELPWISAMIFQLHRVLVQMCKMKAFKELCTPTPDLEEMVMEALKVQSHLVIFGMSFLRPTVLFLVLFEVLKGWVKRNSFNLVSLSKFTTWIYTRFSLWRNAQFYFSSATDYVSQNVWRSNCDLRLSTLGPLPNYIVHIYTDMTNVCLNVYVGFNMHRSIGKTIV